MVNPSTHGVRGRYHFFNLYLFSNIKVIYLLFSSVWLFLNVSKQLFSLFDFFLSVSPPIGKIHLQCIEGHLNIRKRMKMRKIGSNVCTLMCLSHDNQLTLGTTTINLSLDLLFPVIYLAMVSPLTTRLSMFFQTKTPPNLQIEPPLLKQADLSLLQLNLT